MEWADDVANRPRRANAGNHLQELLENGLDEEDERDLLQLDNSSSDTSFTLGTDEETIDEVESDFDAEEVAGVLEGEAVETEATVRRAERQERQRERKKKLQRTRNFSKAAVHDRAMQKKVQRIQRRSQTREQPRKRERKERVGSAPDASSASPSASSTTSDDDDGNSNTNADGAEAVIDLRQRVRHRPAPTIPCEQRLAEAQERAASRRAAQAALAEGGGGEEDAADAGAMMNTHRGLNMDKMSQRARRKAKARRLGGSAGDAINGDTPSLALQPMPFFASPRLALYGGTPQRIGYCSSVSVLEKFSVPSVISFSEHLPPVFQR